MIYKKIILLPMLLLSIMFYSCSDSPSSIGNNILSPDFVSVHKFDTYQDSVLQTSSYYKTSVRLSDSPRLFLGKYANVEASILIKFAVVITDDSLKQAVLNNTATIISSKVDLTRVYNIGENTGALNYGVHLVNNAWTALYNADSLVDYNSEDISSDKSYTDSLYSFKLDNTKVFDWLKVFADTSYSVKNNGIYIIPDPASNGIAGFDAYNVSAVGLPRLTVVVSVSGNVDTLSYISLPDVSIIKGELPSVPSEDIVVQAGLAVNSKVNFDLSSIEGGSVVNKAQLTLYLDTLETKTADHFTNALTVYFVKDSTINSYDTASGIVLSRVQNYFTGDIAPFVQSIVSGFHQNQGFIIAAGGQKTGVDLFALKGSGSSDASLKPHLVITYTGRK